MNVVRNDKIMCDRYSVKNDCALYFLASNFTCIPALFHAHSMQNLVSHIY